MTKPSGRKRHSFVQFYMADWLAGTARMPRLARSIYFDVCVYCWDKAEPVPKAELMLMVSDLEPDQANFLVQNLVDTGKLKENEDGSVYSERALDEARRALAAWEAKSRGGQSKAAAPKPTAKSVPTKQEDTSKSVPLEPEPEPEPEKERVPSGTPKKAAAVKEPDIAVQVEEANALMSIVEAWNFMAGPAKLTKIARLTDERKRQLRARIAEHTAAEIITAIATIPQSPFLMGENDRRWKANIEWLMRPANCVKLIEGGYHNEGRGRGSAWVG